MMRRFKRSLASLLVAVMLVSSLPAALAAEPEGDVLPLEQTVEDSAEASGELYYFQSIADAEQTAVPNEDGAYILILRQGTQFPCEVALFDPAVEDEDAAYFSVIFENDTDPVEADGRTFLPQVSEEDGEEGPTTDPYSLLPLKEYTFSVDLSKYVGIELEAVPLREVLTEPATESKAAVPHYTQGQTVVCISQTGIAVDNENGTIDLRSYMNRHGLFLELIVGSNDQFNPNNIRCLVTVTLADPTDLLEFKATVGETSLTLDGVDFESSHDEESNRYIEYYRLTKQNYGSDTPAVSFWDADEVKLGLDFKTAPESTMDGLTAVVYRKKYESPSSYSLEDITSRIWGDDAEGFLGNYSTEFSTLPEFVVELQRNGEEIYSYDFKVFIPCTNPYQLLDFEVYGADGTKIPANSFDHSLRDYSNNSDYLYGSSGCKYYTTVSSGDWERIADGSLTMKWHSYYGNEGNRAGAAIKSVTADGQDVTAEIWSSSSGPVPDGVQGDYTDRTKTPQFRVVLEKGEKTFLLDFSVIVQESGIRGYISYELYADVSGNRSKVTRSRRYATTADKPGQQHYIYTLERNYSATGTYYLNLSLYNSAPGADSSNNGIHYVDKAVLGDFTTAAQIAKQPDVQKKLFETAENNAVNTGYAVDFSRGPVEFTVLDTEGGIHRFAVELEEYTTTLSSNTYLKMRSVKESPSGSEYKSYVMGSYDDSYYYKGYQTIFLLKDDGSPVNAEKITPVFRSDSDTTIYLGLNQTSGTVQESGKSEIPFVSGQPQAYSAAAADKHLDNYQITFLTQQPGAKLFVNAVSNSAHKENGVARREVMLTRRYDYHDILLANIGKEELTGLSVSLTDNPLIQLDEYWTVKSDGVRKLAGFTTTDGTYVNDNGKEVDAYYGELPNLAKVSLIPILDEDGMLQSGVVDATLTISSENGGSETVKLSGLSGRLGITTREMNPGVKYVPYSQLIQTNALRGAGNVVFEIVKGVLPNGLELYPDGEIYGAPQAFGEWTFTVKSYFEGYEEEAVQREFTITIADNTDENVYMTSDTSETPSENYAIKKPIGSDVSGNHHFVLTERGDQEYISYGEYPEFVKLWLDGRELVPGTDYDARSGSTVITVWGETIGQSDDGSDKSHTISAEFRTGGEERSGDLKKTSQNFVIDFSSPKPDKPDDSGSGSGGNSGGGSKPSSGNSGSSQKPGSSGTQDPVIPPAPPETPDTLFDDVHTSNWFYDDVKWAKDMGLMIGVSNRLFAPQEPISQATVVTLLARMSGIDLTKYDGITDGDIESGQWYTNAAIWAKRSGLLPDNTDFKGTDPIARADMAIMLVKYLRSLGIDTSMPETTLVFADAGLMSEAENNAFQVLYRYGIFKGVSELRMDPSGFTTRAQFAALMHRISIFIESK